MRFAFVILHLQEHSERVTVDLPGKNRKNSENMQHTQRTKTHLSWSLPTIWLIHILVEKLTKLPKNFLKSSSNQRSFLDIGKELWVGDFDCLAIFSFLSMEM